MPNVVLIKNNKVVSIVFSVDADAAALSDAAQVGDTYDPATGNFCAPQPEPQPEPAPVPNETPME